MNAGRNYREAAVGGASPLGLVARLYEQAIEDLRQALRAMERNDIALRSNKINHALLVVAHLQSQLDFERGGKVARDLERFYNVLRENLVQAQILNSQALLWQQITDLLEVRDAWQEAERAEGSAVSARMPAADPMEAQSYEADRSRVGWEG